jgi:hypothetical protein
MALDAEYRAYRGQCESLAGWLDIRFPSKRAGGPRLSGLFRCPNMRLAREEREFGSWKDQRQCFQEVGEYREASPKANSALFRPVGTPQSEVPGLESPASPGPHAPGHFRLSHGV